MTAETNQGGGRAGNLAQRAALKAFPLAPLALFWVLGWAGGVDYFTGHGQAGYYLDDFYLIFWYSVGAVSLAAWFSPLFRPAGEIGRWRRWLTAGGVGVHMVAAASVCFATLFALGGAAWNIGGALVIAACAWSVVWTAARGFGAFQGLSLPDHSSCARLPMAALGVGWSIDKYYDQPLPWLAAQIMPATEIMIAVAAICSLAWLAHACVTMFAPEPPPEPEYHLAA